MKNKMDLLLEREKIKAGFVFKEMDQLVEEAHKDILKSYRPVFFMSIFTSLWALVGLGCFLFLTRKLEGPLWLVAWTGDVLGTTTIVLRAWKDWKDHKRYIASHIKWQAEHKKMLTEAGIPVIAREEKSAPIQEKMVN